MCKELNICPSFGTFTLKTMRHVTLCSHREHLNPPHRRFSYVYTHVRVFDARMRPPSDRSSRSSPASGPFPSLLSLSVPDAFVPRCREAAALVAVRYARLADEKNKRRRNAERQKERVDGGGRAERKKERSSERE